MTFEILALAVCGHQSSVNLSRNAEVLVDAALAKFDFERFCFAVVPDRSEIA